MAGESIIESQEEVVKKFDTYFKNWVSQFAPAADETNQTALRAIAWYWYSQGRKDTFYRLGKELMNQARSVIEQAGFEFGGNG